MQIEIHKKIKEKLEYFYKVHKIPNIIFHGPSGSGKKTIVNNFIGNIYNKDKENNFYDVQKLALMLFYNLTITLITYILKTKFIQEKHI